MAAAHDETLPEVFGLLRQRAGINPESFGSQAIAHAVRKRISTTGEDSAQEYLRRLSRDAAEFQELLEEVAVPETWFFRDVLAFRSLGRYLDARSALGRGRVRVLSVGCSTGEEVYSLAIALREAGLEPSHFCILGTDLSRRALDSAREGRFAPRSFREADESVRTLCDRWCDRDGECWRMRDELRGGVEFQWGNLAQPEFLPGEAPFQVVFCRNVLIYFHAEARRMAVAHLDRLLSPEGFLCSAPAEAPIFSEAGYCSLGSECPFAFRRRALPKGPVPFSSNENRDSPQRLSPDWIAEGVPVAASLPLRETRADEPPMAPPLPLTTRDSIDPSQLDPASILRAAQQAADNGLLEEADALCGQVLSRDAVSAEAHCLKGVVLQARGMLDAAQRSLEKALYLDPRHYQALVHLMLLAEQRGDQPAAVNYRRRAQQAALREVE